MSYETLAKDIADDIKSDILGNIINTRSDLDRAVEESAGGSEVSFKPFAAKKYLEQHGLFVNVKDPLEYVNNHLTTAIYAELEDLDVEGIFYSRA